MPCHPVQNPQGGAEAAGCQAAGVCGPGTGYGEHVQVSEQGQWDQGLCYPGTFSVTIIISISQCSFLQQTKENTKWGKRTSLKPVCQRNTAVNLDVDVVVLPPGGKQAKRQHKAQGLPAFDLLWENSHFREKHYGWKY